MPFVVVNAQHRSQDQLSRSAALVGKGAVLSVYTVTRSGVDDLQETFVATTWDLHGIARMRLARICPG